MKWALSSWLVVVLVVSAVEAREWTDASTNKKIDAEFVQRIGDKVVLRLPGDGKLYTVPLSRLCAADRTFVETAKAGASVLDRYVEKSREIVVDTSGDDRWSAAIRSDPNNPTHYTRRGMARVAKGEHDAAIKDFSKALSLNPKDPDAYNGRGKAYAKAGQPVKAHNDFGKAIEMDAKLASAFRHRADNMKALAETPEGKELLDEARSKLKKKWEAMAAHNNKVSPWQPLNSTTGPITADMLALGLAKRDYKYAEMLTWDADYNLGLNGGVSIGGGGVSIGIGGGGVGAAVGVGVVGGQAPLTIYPETVIKGEPITLIADMKSLQLGMPQKVGANGRPVYSGGKIKTPVKEGVEAVDFYRDIDGDGNLDTAKDQYIGSDTNAKDGFSIEAPTQTFALGENVFFAEPRGAEGSDKKAGPDYNTVASKLEQAAKDERTIAADAAEGELSEDSSKALRDDQRGVQSKARSVMKALKATAPEAYETLKEVSRSSLDINKELTALDAEAAAKSAEDNAKRIEDLALELRDLAKTQSTAATGTPAYAPGRIMPGKGEGEGKGGGDGKGGGGGGDGDGGGGYGGDRYADRPDRVERAVDYIDRGDYDRAVVEYDRLIEEDPDNDYYLRQRAGAYLAKGGYDHAIRDFDRLVELDVKNADLYYNRGCARLAAGEISAALADFSISIDLDETRNLAYTNRGVAYARSGKMEEAISDFNKAISLNATDTLAYRNRALAYRKLGRQTEAEADLLKLKQLSEVTIIKP
jgi:tetratricopeptide (TPR) repeat protein